MRRKILRLQFCLCLLNDSLGNDTLLCNFSQIEKNRKMDNLGQIISKNQHLNELKQKNVHIKYLDKIFKTCLDESLAKNCYLANIGESNEENNKQNKSKITLLVAVTNQAFATRLRYAIPDILKNLKTHSEFQNVTDITYTLNIREEKQEFKPIKKPLSPENEKRWRELLAKLREKNNA
jgi:hypothetical protein